MAHEIVDFVNSIGGFPALCSAILSIAFLIFLKKMGEIMKEEPISEEDIIKMGDNSKKSTKSSGDRIRSHVKPSRKRRYRVRFN